MVVERFVVWFSCQEPPPSNQLSLHRTAHTDREEEKNGFLSLLLSDLPGREAPQPAPDVYGPSFGHCHTTGQEEARGQPGKGLHGDCAGNDGIKFYVRARRWVSRRPALWCRRGGADRESLFGVSFSRSSWPATLQDSFCQCTKCSSSGKRRPARDLAFTCSPSGASSPAA